MWKFHKASITKAGNTCLTVATSIVTDVEVMPGVILPRKVSKFGFMVFEGDVADSFSGVTRGDEMPHLSSYIADDEGWLQLEGE